MADPNRHGAGDDNKRVASVGYSADERKHRALAGQWQTPPTPAYATGPPQQQPPQQPPQPQQAAQIARSPSHDGPLPVSTPEEYAQALQEAYEAGARMAQKQQQQHQQQQQQQQQHMPTAASCPDFSSTGSKHQHQHPAAGSGSVSERATAPPVPAFRMDHQIHPPAQLPRNPSGSIPDPLSSSMPPPPPPQATASYAPMAPGGEPQQPLQPQPQQHQAYLQPHQGGPQDPYAVGGQPQHALAHAHPRAHPHAHPNQGVPPHPLPATSSGVCYPPPAKPKAPEARPQQQPQQQQQQQQPGRSMSMPDMSTYAAEAEEEKRLKRLARNRASARLRRLRKKNLVDAYETEVGILEKTLGELQAHEWGRDTDDHKPLLDALGMERGQQPISPEERTEIIRDILEQQMQQVALLREAQREQEILALLAVGKGGDGTEEDEMVRELREILQLSDDQEKRLEESTKGLDKEAEALETVAASLRVIQKNDWLLNEGVQKITDQFTSILHKNQQSKLLLWTDANAEAVDQLDHVEVQPLQSAPVFSFGVESTAPGEDE